MTPEKLNRQVQSELALLVAQGVLTFDQLDRLRERYPTGRWNVAALVRWFTMLGVVSMGAGVLVLATEVMDSWLLIEGGLALATVGLLALGRWLGHRRGMPKTGATLELLGAAALQGLTVSLAIHYSTGSKNWPALVGIDTLLIALLAYALRNRLVLIYAAVNFYLWFGGSTGYMSGWGAYWLGMDYPLRFFVAGLVTLAVAWLHYRYGRGAYQGFSRVYLHYGLLILHFSLWFFSVFGYFEKDVQWEGTEGQRLGFTVLWALISGACIFAASRTGLRLIRSYGVTFLTINLYTFYFQFIAANSFGLWWIHLLIIGGSMVAGGLWIEKARRGPDVGLE